MAVARIYGKGQVVVPKSARDQLGLEVGDELLVEVRGDEIVMRKPQSVFDLTPPRRRRDVGLSDRETTDAAWDEHVSEKFVSGRRG
jgi:AbrB family looped-hinge helix DNA binding protein